MATKIRDSIVQLINHDIALKNDEDIVHVIEQANTKGFDRYKLEKDFWLTICLQYLATTCPEIAFKGWTCLNKIYQPYFRLSEDLDFSQTLKNYPGDGDRKHFAREMRSHIKHIAKGMWWELDDDSKHHKKARGNLHIADKKYTYLKYILTYQSLWDQSNQEIKIEVTYTHQRHLPTVSKPIQSLYTDLIFEEPLFPYQEIHCMSLNEMIAEKMRAALTRQYPAIRDFFDIRWMKQKRFDFESISELVKEKIEESWNRITIYEAYDDLLGQVDDELWPVLSENYSFNFDRVFKWATSYHERLVASSNE